MGEWLEWHRQHGVQILTLNTGNFNRISSLALPSPSLHLFIIRGFINTLFSLLCSILPPKTSRSQLLLSWKTFSITRRGQTSSSCQESSSHCTDHSHEYQFIQLDRYLSLTFDCRVHILFFLQPETQWPSSLMVLVGSCGCHDKIPQTRQMTNYP